MLGYGTINATGNIVFNYVSSYGSYSNYDAPPVEPTWRELRKMQALEFAAQFLWELNEFLKTAKMGISFTAAEPAIEVPYVARGKTGANDPRWKMKRWKQQYRRAS